MPIITQTRSLSINSLSTLVYLSHDHYLFLVLGVINHSLTVASKLEPLLSDAEQFEILKTVTDSTIPAPTLSPNMKRKDITIVTDYLKLPKLIICILDT